MPPSLRNNMATWRQASRSICVLGQWRRGSFCHAEPLPWTSFVTARHEQDLISLTYNMGGTSSSLSILDSDRNHYRSSDLESMSMKLQLELWALFSKRTSVDIDKFVWLWSQWNWALYHDCVIRTHWSVVFPGQWGEFEAVNRQPASWADFTAPLLYVVGQGWLGPIHGLNVWPSSACYGPEGVSLSI